MKNKIRITSLFTFIFVSSVSFAQYKYDIGLKASTYDLERFQLEQRFHFDSPWSLVVTMVSGSRKIGESSQTSIYNDSLFDLTFRNFTSRNNGLKLGVQRKLGFFATDVFYVGATLGMGYEKQRTNIYFTTYSNPNGVDYSQNAEIAYEAKEYNSSWFNSQLALSFGMDVPISKRLSINAELGLTGILSRSMNYDLTVFYMHGAVSGGLRYQLGKRS